MSTRVVSPSDKQYAIEIIPLLYRNIYYEIMNESDAYKKGIESQPTTTTSSMTKTTTTNDPDSSRMMMEQPGSGWSNGAIVVPKQSVLYPNTQNGKKELYSKERRWIGLYGTGWTRLGETGHEHDRFTSSSSNLPSSSNNTDDTKKQTPTIEDVDQQAYAVRTLIAQLCESFYHMGWATGTGGGCSIRVVHPITKEYRVFVAPSGIQKEDMIGDDIFELNMNRDIIIPPKTYGLRQSACTPLWYIVYKYRPNVSCVIHTHSLNAVQATLLDPTEQSKSLRITHLEMLKGCGYHGYDDYLDIPIIDNRPTEDLLAQQLENAIQQYPKCNAVLVRRHGIYCWGDTWEQAKTQCESFDYLFDCIIKMKLLGINYSVPPISGTYRENENDANNNNDLDNLSKKRKILNDNNNTTTHNNNGFHGLSAIDNHEDCVSCPVPLLPRDKQYKFILLDIEGCTTSISFVKDVLFPYSRERFDDYFNKLQNKDPIQYEKIRTSLIDEVVLLVRNGKCTLRLEDVQVSDASSLAKVLLDADCKVAPLKEVQGSIWKEGYDNGTIQGHIYSDVLSAFQWFQKHNIGIGIYSSGSIQAQKLLFNTTMYGDLLPYINNHHYDIVSVGSKKDASSYIKIAQSIDVPIGQICFVSDSIDELIAAKNAGIVGTVCSIRPGNVPLHVAYKGAEKVRQPFPTIHSLLQLCGAE
jgi:methylthioribulose 1-phosphate dehydratase / enolase-phosphatase E1